MPLSFGRGDPERNGAPNTLRPPDHPEPPAPATSSKLPEPSGLAELSQPSDRTHSSDSPVLTEAPTATSNEADGLLARWRADDPEAPIDAIDAAPASATLTLELNARFLNQSPAQRQSQSERWLERAAGLGYGHLRLVDGQGRLLGRDAWVGGGMLLLRPPDPELASP